MKIELPVTDHGKIQTILGYVSRVVIDYRYFNGKIYIIAAALKMVNGNVKIYGPIKEDQYPDLIKLHGDDLIKHAESLQHLNECECQAI